MQRYRAGKSGISDMTVSAETVVALQKSIAELEKKLKAAPDKDTSAYRTLKKDLTQLYIQQGDVLKDNSKFLDACAAYYRAYEFTRSYIAMKRLRLDSELNRSLRVTHKINISAADSDEQAFEYFRCGLQALSGIGLPTPDESKAFAYFKAAGKKHPPSRYMLGFLYYAGRGVD